MLKDKALEHRLDARSVGRAVLTRLGPRYGVPATTGQHLAAGESLLAQGHLNAAASRYYYAMYQAAVHRLTLKGHRPGTIRSGAVDWDHSMVENNVFMCRRERRDRPLYAVMRRLRGQADYDDDAVETWRLNERRDAIRDFVGEVTR